ncbi:MAG: PilN domain-containing protein [Elusimicrobia bacterium]|nr:PilN domain-containing protein [Elusimicrobiota bacterium]
MIKVNLVPAEILAKARQRQMIVQGAVAGGLLALIMVALSLGHWYGLYRLKNEYSYKKSVLNNLSAIVKQVEELQTESQSVRARLGVIDSLLKGRAFYPLFMSEFARTVPSGIQVTDLTTAAQGADALKLSIAGTANTNDDIASWLRGFQKHPNFSAVNLGPVSASGKGYSFTMTAVYTNKL